MLLFTRLAVVTSAFYLGFALLLDGIKLALTVNTGGFAILLNRNGFLLFFGVLWLISFLLSWRLVVNSMLSKVVH